MTARRLGSEVTVDGLLLYRLHAHVVPKLLKGKRYPKGHIPAGFNHLLLYQCSFQHRALLELQGPSCEELRAVGFRL
jgi:hypothetical protein